MLPDLQADRIRSEDLDAQILELERTLQTIRTEKALVQERLDSYKYPVLTLPNEIISEIFVHFLPVYPACPPLTGILSPTNLTQICRKWRELALATPLLWRAMRLASSNISPQRQAQKIDMWFNMSGCCPISLQIVGYNSSLESKVVDALAPHHARWEHIKLALADIPRNHVLLLFTRPMPLLRHIELELNDDGDGDPIVFGEAPLLQSAILDDIAAKEVVLPWAQLTSLTLRAPQHECAAILIYTPNLVYCNLDFTTGYGITGALPTFTFLHLESLVLADQYPDARDYMRTFILPNLRELQIAERLLGPTPRDSLASFISKSGCKLQTLYLTGPRRVSEDTYHTAFPSIWLSFDGKYVGTGTDVASNTDAWDVESNADSSENDENDTDSSDVEDD